MLIEKITTMADVDQMMIQYKPNVFDITSPQKQSVDLQNTAAANDTSEALANLQLNVEVNVILHYYWNRKTQHSFWLAAIY